MCTLHANAFNLQFRFIHFAHFRRVETSRPHKECCKALGGAQEQAALDKL